MFQLGLVIHLVDLYCLFPLSSKLISSKLETIYTEAISGRSGENKLKVPIHFLCRWDKKVKPYSLQCHSFSSRIPVSSLCRMPATKWLDIAQGPASSTKGL